MSVKIIRDYTIDDEPFTLGKPEQVSDNILNIPILFNSVEKDGFAALQTPKIHFDCPNGSPSGTRLLFDQASNKIKHFYSYVQSFEDKVISKLQSQLNTLFKSDNIDANDLFKSSIRFPKSLDSCCYMSVQLSPGFHVFDHSGNKIEQQDLTKSPQGTATFILSCESVSITPIQAYINWKIEQVQLHRPPKKQKKVSSKIKSFGIIVDEDPDGAAEPPAPVREAEGDDRRSSGSRPDGDTITISLNELNS